MFTLQHVAFYGNSTFFRRLTDVSQNLAHSVSTLHAKTVGLLEMTQLMRKLLIALTLILREFPGPTA